MAGITARCWMGLQLGLLVDSHIIDKWLCGYRTRGDYCMSGTYQGAGHG